MDISEEWKKLRPEVGNMICRIDSKIKSVEAEEKRIQEKRDESYLRGLNDAWEAARLMISMTSTECFNCFGDGGGQGDGYYFMDGIYKITPQEAIEKIRIYTEKKEAKEEEKLHVGDEVFMLGDEEFYYIVLYKLCEDVNLFKVIEPETLFTHTYSAEYLKKTGKHYDSIPLPKEKKPEKWYKK